MPAIEEIATFCKRKGFVYPSSEIYGGLSGFWDFGPLGAELKGNLKREFWKTFVHQRDDIVGIDGSIVSHPGIWKASGHVDSFVDVLVDCKKCGSRYRADHLLEDTLKMHTEGMTPEKMGETLRARNIRCQKCKSELGEPRRFNLMFTTNVGPIQDSSSLSYLRPETAQLIFANFKNVFETTRVKLPFGIAQMGKAFRNEISPRDFLFRMREFEQMEIEYFIHPQDKGCPWVDSVAGTELLVYSEGMQKSGEKEKKMSIRHALDGVIIRNSWHAYWLASMFNWFVSLGANPEKFRIRQHLREELSHYSSDTWDLEYNFPFGWKELAGVADRGDFDLRQHEKFSKQDLSVFDETSKSKVVPHVVCEPSLGVERAFLVFLFDSYVFDEKRENIVLRLHPKLSPVKAGVFPLVNKDGLPEKAREIYSELKQDYNIFYDQGGSIGRRYARQDEIGTPICITVDYDTLSDGSVTVRDRDTTEQKRVKISELPSLLSRALKGERIF
ncbi:MAG: glycine--tRNA ligase [Candidatus Aenigmarchaeota archaeon]|nr:glycine--tRNA ligase [Candidatus Aenigmarchaeota archaeon]